jgi:hypothetical protein
MRELCMNNTSQRFLLLQFYHNLLLLHRMQLEVSVQIMDAPQCTAMNADSRRSCSCSVLEGNLDARGVIHFHQRAWSFGGGEEYGEVGYQAGHPSIY